MFELFKLIQMKKQLQLSLVGVNGLTDAYRYCYGCEGNCSGSCSGSCEDTCDSRCGDSCGSCGSN